MSGREGFEQATSEGQSDLENVSMRKEELMERASKISKADIEDQVMMLRQKETSVTAQKNIEASLKTSLKIIGMALDSMSDEEREMPAAKGLYELIKIIEEQGLVRLQ